ncbi:MAG: HEAT repeat domain-containing protein [Candidatus Brocadiaceae bacterium]|jgi:HEAT repeat protein
MSPSDTQPAPEPVAVPPFAAHGAQPAAGDAGSKQEETQKLAALLQSDAPGFEKDVACRRLAVIGTKAAVPALAALLSDETLSDMARYGLEPIPDPSVDRALRAAMPRLTGRPLIGVITSIGNRGDRKAIRALIKLLGGANEGVVAAAAMSLGKIGGQRSARALSQALGRAPAHVRPAIADGCLRCAQTALAQGNRKQAAALYEAVRAAGLPAHIAAAARMDGGLAER